MKKKGFSIVELIVYCGLLSVLLVVITSLFTSIINLQMETESDSAVAQDGNYLLSRLTYDLRKATAVTLPTLGSTSEGLTFTSGGTSYTYDLQGAFLRLNGENLNSYQTRVSNLSFTHLGLGTGKEDSVQIVFTITSTIMQNKGYETKDFATTVGLRPN